jgi:SAM-dependent methyltransferase
MEDVLGAVAHYYTGTLAAHGPTARGVDWSSAASQALRFEQLLRICEGEDAFSLLDFGCGYGALLDHPRLHRPTVDYCGFDIAPSMLTEALRLHPEGPRCRFVGEASSLHAADYVVASGIFNVRVSTSDEAWLEYILGTLTTLDALALRGFAFNILSLWSDPPKRRPHLYYADPLKIFEHCRSRFSSKLSLLHDYPLYEFTILVRKGSAHGQAGDLRGR